MTDATKALAIVGIGALALHLLSRQASASGTDGASGAPAGESSPFSLSIDQPGTEAVLEGPLLPGDSGFTPGGGPATFPVEDGGATGALFPALEEWGLANQTLIGAGTLAGLGLASRLGRGGRSRAPTPTQAVKARVARPGTAPRPQMAPQVKPAAPPAQSGGRSRSPGGRVQGTARPRVGVGAKAGGAAAVVLAAANLPHAVDQYNALRGAGESRTTAGSAAVVQTVSGISAMDAAQQSRALQQQGRSKVASDTLATAGAFGGFDASKATQTVEYWTAPRQGAGRFERAATNLGGGTIAVAQLSGEGLVNIGKGLAAAPGSIWGGVKRLFG